MKMAVNLLFVIVVSMPMSLAQNTGAKPAPGAFVKVNGGQLYYDEYGAGPEAVVLLHDGVANSAVWDDVRPSFCKSFHIIRYDRREYGRSPETKSAYYEGNDLAALLHSRKIRHAALVASSHGGQVAMEFALRYPELVEQLVVVGPEVTGFPYSEHFLMREYSNQQSKKVEDLREASVQDQFLIVPGHDAARKRLREILTAAPQDLTHNDMPLPEPSIFPHVKELRMPTLVLIGSGDIADNQAVAGALVVTIQGAARIVVLSCLSWKWRERSSVKITERTYEEALHRRRESSRLEASSFGQGCGLGPV
jgi:3-oxoadipate enol-lactonase